MKKIEIEIPEGKRAEWVNGVLTLVDDKPTEYKYKVGDKVKVVHHNDGLAYEVVEQCLCDGEPAYYIKHNDLVELCYEKYLELIPQDITERIKTFEDACKWCENNDRKEVVGELEDITYCNPCSPSDILAYLKLRIITCALNEGWEPKFAKYEKRFYPYYHTGVIETDVGVNIVDMNSSAFSLPAKLCFKSEELAKYAFSQFRDIYAVFCGYKEGGEE